MKAILFTRYGLPQDLQFGEAEKPAPEDNQVLVKIKAAAVNDWDWLYVQGKPALIRPVFGLFKPKINILGVEIAGTVKAVGNKVKKLKPGDAVYGDISDFGMGGFAEYAAVPEKALTIKPPGMTFEQAAALPHAAGLTLQGLCDHGRIKKGDKVLINGAGGGVGTLGVQIAKTFGVEITGVDSGAKLDMMRSAGYDHVIDYTKEDFTRTGQKYDLILDTKTNRSIFAYLRALRPKGTYATVGGSVPRVFLILFISPLIRLVFRKRLRLVGLKTNKDMDRVNGLFKAGKLKPVLDGPFTLDKVPEALQYFGEAKHKGKVIITMEADRA
jgi:NADPH:quinone reductase-like Zn-dependent oxidoreductase